MNIGIESARKAIEELDGLKLSEEKSLKVQYHKNKLEREREKKLKSFQNDMILSKSALFVKNFPRKYKEIDLQNNFGRFGEI